MALQTLHISKWAPLFWFEGGVHLSLGAHYIFQLWRRTFIYTGALFQIITVSNVCISNFFFSNWSSEIYFLCCIIVEPTTGRTIKCWWCSCCRCNSMSVLFFVSILIMQQLITLFISGKAFEYLWIEFLVDSFRVSYSLNPFS